VENNEALDPIQISLFGTVGIMFRVEGLLNLVQQLLVFYINTFYLLWKDQRYLCAICYIFVINTMDPYEHSFHSAA